MDMLQDVRVGPLAGKEATVKVTGRKGSKPVTVLPPPASFATQLGLVEGLNRQRPDRAAEILTQMAYSPSFWAGILPLSPRRTPRTLELMAASVMFAAFVVQQAKVRFNLPRPVALSPRIQPIIETPGFSTYPSGHATQAALVSGLLWQLAGPSLASDWRASVKGMLDDLAARIGQNREVAGVHFPADTEAGRKLAVGGPAVGESVGGKGDAPGASLLGMLLHAAGVAPFDPAAAAPRAAAAPASVDQPLAWLWRQAAAEWAA